MQKIGNYLVARKSENQDIVSMCILAYNKLKNKINTNKVKCIILCLRIRIWRIASQFCNNSIKNTKIIT